ATKGIDDCRRASSRASAIAIGHDISRGVYKHGVRAGHEQVDGKSATRVNDAPHLPIAQRSLCESIEITAKLLSPSEGQLIEEAKIECMAHIEVVVAIIVVVIEGITRGKGFVGATRCTKIVSPSVLRGNSESAIAAADDLSL